MESESELLNLAAVPYQLISPANNSTIVGIFQDSLLGTFQITRENINFSKRDAMNLLMNYDNIDTSIFEKETITSFDVLSQIMPPMTMVYRTKNFKEGKDDYSTSNKVLELNGKVEIKHFNKKLNLRNLNKLKISGFCSDSFYRMSEDELKIFMNSKK